MMKPLQNALRKTLGIQALAIAAAVGCGENVTTPKSEAAPQFVSVSGSPRAKSEKSASGFAKDAAAPVAPPMPSQGASSEQPAVVSPTMVIRNGAVTVEVDSLELAMAALQKLASSMGGYVGNTSRTTGAFAVRSATLELKIPSTRYDSTVGGLRPLGKIESETSTAEDVGEEFVDITARQANSHKLEERLIALLATRTGKLEDVLAVERELARVREEIERYEGRLRYLRSHVVTSTLTVTIHEHTPVISDYAGRNVISESFKTAWRNFVAFVALFISSLGWLVPLGVMVLVGFLLVRRFGKADPPAPPKA